MANISNEAKETKPKNKENIDLREDFPKDKIKEIKEDSPNWNLSYPYIFEIYKNFPGGTLTKGRHTLNLAPQNINIQTPFAASVSATNKGIIEENNGTVFRVITISGTTGLWAQKKNATAKKSSTEKFASSLFPGTTSAIKGLINKAKGFVSAIVGPDEKKPEKSGKDSGYYQFWRLYNMFVQYTEKKKTIDGKDFRLAFKCPKDNISYICTPLSFELKRDSSNPLLYNYNIVLKAWDIDSATAFPNDIFAGIPTPDNVGAIKGLTNTLQSARGVLDGARNILKGVNSDFASIMNVWNQGTLVLKEFAGVINDVRDFGTIFKNNAAILITGSTNSAVKALRDSSTTKTKFYDTEEKESVKVNASTSGAIMSLSSSEVGIGNKKTQAGEDKTEKNYNKQQIENQLNQAVDTNNEAFLNTPLSEIEIPASVQTQIDEEKERARNLTSNDIRNLVSKLTEVSDNHAYNFNMMDSDYARVYGLPAPEASTKQPTEDDLIVANSIIESRDVFTSTLAAGELFLEKETDPFVSANPNIEESERIISPLSFYPVSFEREATLEKMAQKYLGDAKRFREIVILNGLRTPYIDEAGFSVSIYSAEGRNFVTNTTENLTIGQKITISGTNKPSTKRKIMNITDIGGGQYRVVVNGNPNLSLYIPSCNPVISTRLPGTVGSGDVLMIPSDSSPIDQQTRPTALMETMSAAEKVFKVDIALNKDGTDLAIESNGDLKKVYGYENAVQAIRLALEVEQKELENHPEYGLPPMLAQRTSDTSFNEIKEAVDNVILKDPRFVNVESNISIEGSVAKIFLTAEGAKGAGNIPVEFVVGLE